MTRESADVPTAKNPSPLDYWPEDHLFEDGQNFCLWRIIRLAWSDWTFSYMAIILRKGKRQKRDGVHLTQEDLYKIPESMESSHLVHEFVRFTNFPRSKDAGARKLLLRTLWKISAPTYIPAGFCELIVVACSTALPLLVRGLLKILEDKPDAKVVRSGLPYAVSIFLVCVLNALGNHRHRHLSLKTGVVLRSVVINVLYRHVMRLSPRGKMGLTSGEAANLVAVDAQKLFEVTQDGHLVWALPLSILLTSFFLYQTLGPSTLVGIAVLVAFVPLIERISSLMLAVRGERMKCTDQRVELINTLLQGMKVTKLNNYESKYETQVTAVRNNELKYLQREMAIWATTLVITVTSPLLATAASFTTYAMIDENNILTAADTFAVILLFSALRFPINFAGRLIGKVTQALSAINRIVHFLERPLHNDDIDSSLSKDIDTGGIAHLKTENGGKEEKGNPPPPLVLSKASFGICGGKFSAGAAAGEAREDDITAFTVSEFNFSLSKGEVMVVCGPVGSGKSTFLNGILGESERLGETILTKRGKISYAPQTPFIINQTLRNNILFGLPLDCERYEKILDACCLRPDLEQLGENGDLIEIGERGVTLSGGQKQRVLLARAAYAQSAVMILDDPFSALDSATGRAVFERLIASPEAVLRDSAVLLVTHASHFISNQAIDKILVIVDGSNKFLGSWDQLTEFVPKDESTQRAVEFIKSSVQETTEGKNNEGVNAQVTKNESKNIKELMQEEIREFGLSRPTTWLLWFRQAGGIPFITIQIVLMTIDRAAYVFVEWFLARWTSGASRPINILGIHFPAQTDGFAAQAQYLKFYWPLIGVSIVATLLRSEWCVTGGMRATRQVFKAMLSSVMLAPMSYFETVPLGRILNRFTYDTDITDVTQPQIMSFLIISCSWYVAGVIVQIWILPWSILVLVPVSAMYWILLLHYRFSGPDLQRIDAMTRSPLQSMLSECLEGNASIRAFHQNENFVNRFNGAVDVNSSALLNYVSAQRWLGLRIEVLGSVVILVSTVLLVCLNDIFQIEAGLAGLLIVWCANFTITLGFMVESFSEGEAAITAIERIDAMTDLPRESAMETKNSVDNVVLSKSWPQSGLLEFKKVSMRYREGLPLALNELTFTINSGKTCGVVGRTGAGKSSIAVALFRIVEIEAGSIFLDGVDLGNIGLADVRGRGMSIIPQDPFLTGATLRECLDPFDQYEDSKVLEALKAVRFSNVGTATGDEMLLLHTRLEEGGLNFSLGERQLLNLSRALLSQPKLLLMDEATASIDGETDAFIQRMLRTRFPNTTIVTVAHRLNTIMDYDLVVVMDDGHAVEFGSPAELLEIPGGAFSNLVGATGEESRRSLCEIAKQRFSTA